MDESSICKAAGRSFYHLYFLPYMLFLLLQLTLSSLRRVHFAPSDHRRLSATLAKCACFSPPAVAAGLAGDKELSVVTFAIGLPQRFYLVCTCFFQHVDYFIPKLHAIRGLYWHIQEKIYPLCILSFGVHSMHRDVRCMGKSIVLRFLPTKYRRRIR